MTPTAPPSRNRRASAEDAGLRIALHRLLNAIEKELERRRAEADLEPARTVPVDIESLSSLRGSLPDLAGLGARSMRHLAGIDGSDLARAVRAVSATILRRAELSRRRRSGQTAVDDLGFDREWTETLLPLSAWAYRNWWRVRAIGVENVPASGRALLVSNHAGVIPYDGAMIRTALLLEHSRPRHARALVLSGLFTMPGTSWLMRRTGNTLAHDADARMLLERDELVMVFPEGAKGTGKPYADRYRLRRFGRGGFVEMALRTGSPIIPISVVGSEEIHPNLAEIPILARLLGLPYAPVTPTFPLLGAAGLIPLPSQWIIEFHAPIAVPAHGDQATADPGRVLAISDQVREIIQAGIYCNLQRRHSVFSLS
ncbi:MAG: acyltransferase family protein [Candidatus Dormibacteraeota bacterium]|uniref:Acyltransferase family protein n=1 Tax=Candidatus Amunia macphersoniae TaxID=3127014 RepID=A0A934NFJ5_9BACT|nr:acyltransferase family protein [Candidatus Dormibacteraeota bacterium]